MEKYGLPARTRLLWQIRISAIGLLPALILLFFCKFSLWCLLPAGLLVALTLVAVLWYVPAYFGGYEISLPQGAIVIKSGVFIRTTHIMPFSRLVYLQTYSTPLAKAMGLTALSLKAARARVIVPELYSDEVKLFVDAVSAEEKE